MQADTYRPHGKRYVNGKVELRLPLDILKKKCERYLKNGKPIHRKELETETAYSIMSRYQAEYRGLVEYYQMANDLNKLNRLRWIMEVSLTKTLAAKLKLTVPKVYDKFQTTHMVDEKPYKGLQVVVQREGKEPLVAKWGTFLSGENHAQSSMTSHTRSGRDERNSKNDCSQIPANSVVHTTEFQSTIFEH